MNTNEYRAKVVPVANTDWKEAALYFNHLMPVQMKFLPADVCYGFKDRKTCLDRETWEFARQVYLGKYTEIFNGQPEENSDLNEQNLVRELDIHSVWPIVQRLRLKGIPAVPIFAYRDSYDLLGSGENEAIDIKIIDAKVVDAESLEWDQILEFRQDEESVKDLRNFRLFMFENYKDKSPSYIKDSIEQKIEKHDLATKKHGFKLVKTVTSELVDSKSSLGCLCLATLSYLLGNEETAASLGASGAVIALGKMTISIASEYISYKTDVANPELAYVMKARKLMK